MEFEFRRSEPGSGFQVVKSPLRAQLQGKPPEVGLESMANLR